MRPAYCIDLNCPGRTSCSKSFWRSVEAATESPEWSPFLGHRAQGAETCAAYTLDVAKDWLVLPPPTFEAAAAARPIGWA